MELLGRQFFLSPFVTLSYPYLRTDQPHLLNCYPLLQQQVVFLVYLKFLMLSVLVMMLMLTTQQKDYRQSLVLLSLVLRVWEEVLRSFLTFFRLQLFDFKFTPYLRMDLPHLLNCYPSLQQQVVSLVQLKFWVLSELVMNLMLKIQRKGYLQSFEQSSLVLKVWEEVSMRFLTFCLLQLFDFKFSPYFKMDRYRLTNPHPYFIKELADQRVVLRLVVWNHFVSE